MNATHPRTGDVLEEFAMVLSHRHVNNMTDEQVLALMYALSGQRSTLKIAYVEGHITSWTETRAEQPAALLVRSILALTQAQRSVTSKSARIYRCDGMWTIVFHLFGPRPQLLRFRRVVFTARTLDGLFAKVFLADTAKCDAFAVVLVLSPSMENLPFITLLNEQNRVLFCSWRQSKRVTLEWTL